MSLGREEMLDATGIDKFNYDPHVEHSNAAPEDAEANEASTEDAEATSPEQDPIPTIDP
jgi:hypothetical protein